MPHRVHGPGRACLLALVSMPLLLAVSSACSTSGSAATSTPSSAPSGVYEPNLSIHPSTYGTLGPGYPDPHDPPAPEGTFTPSPSSWEDVQPPAGFRVELVASAHDTEAEVVVGAVRSWAQAAHVRLGVIEVDSPADNVAELNRAMAARPDLVVTAGDSLVDADALVTASALEYRFLVIGGEVAEPTANVTAVDWQGAGFRGEGLGKPTTADPASFTPERAGRAIRAGVAAVLTNWSGFVVWLS